MNDVNENNVNASTVVMPETTTLKAPIFQLDTTAAGTGGDDEALMANKPSDVLSLTASEETVEGRPTKNKPESDTTEIIEEDDDHMFSTADEDEEEHAAAAAGEPTQQHAHPSLDALLLLDVDHSSRQIHPNGEPVRIDNEWLDMKMLIMLRTPNVDDDSAPKGTARNQALSQHFVGKQRRFEFQYQGKLKKKSDDKSFCFCMELAESPKLNFLQKALVTTCMVFMKKMSPSFHFNMTSTPNPTDKANGKYETTHMAFEVDKVLDRLAITKPGETPPTLGGTIPEDPERTKARREGKYQVDWNTDDIYTMTIWSHYIDWIRWEVVHIPGVKHFSLRNVLQDQSVFMQMYLLDKNRENKNKHYQKDIQHVVNLEFQQNPEFVVDVKKVDKSTKRKKKSKSKAPL